VANVLILSLVFPPDNVSTAQLMGDVAYDLQVAGHRVTVISTVPHYNRDSADEGLTRLERSWGGLVQRSAHRGVPVYHVWVPAKGANLGVRLFGWGLFHLMGTALGCLITFRPAVVLAPSPPLTIGVSAWLVARWRRARYVYNVQEIYPDVAIHLGVLRSKVLIRVLLRLERFVYDGAAAVTTISEGMRQRLLTKGVPSDKARLIPNFVDVGLFKELPKRNKFSERHSLAGKFVLTYAGNMGRPQALDAFIHAMAKLTDRPEVHLLMVGSGTEYPRLQQLAAELRLTNVTFLPHQPYTAMPEIYAASDLSIVSQTTGTHSDGIPSKVYRIMGSGRSVFALTDERSDLANLVRDSGGGLVVSSPDASVLARCISEAAARPAHWTECGRRAGCYVEAQFDRRRIAGLYAGLMTELAASRP
jgi:colanic acid biosynthesis glycosyl transferase WcaI